MGRSYAGILGLVAFATVVARGVLQQNGAASIFPLAAASLFLFAGLGYILGTIAAQAVAADLKARFQEQVARLQGEGAKKEGR
jgi:hypothetical protein